MNTVAVGTKHWRIPTGLCYLSRRSGLVLLQGLRPPTLSLFLMQVVVLCVMSELLPSRIRLSRDIELMGGSYHHDLRRTGVS